MAKAPAKAGKKKSFKKKEKRVVHQGIVHVQATFNNTIVTIADQEGNTIAWSSAGSLGFRGSRKGTPFAAQQASLTAANKAKETGLRTVEVRVSGTRVGARIGGERVEHGGHRSSGHPGRDADSAQRLPAAEEAKSLGDRFNFCRRRGNYNGSSCTEEAGRRPAIGRKPHLN